MAFMNVDGISKEYDLGNGNKFKVLRNISLNVGKNEIVSIIGKSGGGKSTLLDCISGITSIDSGNIILNRKIVSGQTGNMSYMMQDDVMLPWRTVYENVSLSFELNRIPAQKIEKEIKELAKLFGLTKFLNFYPYKLSGGMKKRASLMRAYGFGKKIMLLDEPFTKLDAITRSELESWFLNIWQRKKLSVLIVTHDIDEALFLSDRVYIMAPNPGRIIHEEKISLKRPRKSNVLLSKDFLQAKRKLLKILNKSE